MNNDDHIARVSDWFKGHPVRIGILVAGVIAVVLLVAFNQQIGDLLNLTGSRADTGKEIKVNGKNLLAGGYHFFSDGYLDQPTGADCFTVTTDETKRLMLNSACPQPHVTSLSSDRGPVGSQITINGTGFTVGTTVKIGEVDAIIEEGGITPTAITITIPDQAPGTFPVLVNALGGASDSSQSFTYATAPQISDIFHNSDAVGNEVKITGTNFGINTDLAKVSFGSFLVTEIVSWSDTEIRVKVPADDGTNPTVRVIVTNSDGLESPDGLFDTFTYANL